MNNAKKQILKLFFDYKIFKELKGVLYKKHPINAKLLIFSEHKSSGYFCQFSEHRKSIEFLRSYSYPEKIFNSTQKSPLLFKQGAL